MEVIPTVECVQVDAQPRVLVVGMPVSPAHSLPSLQPLWAKPHGSATAVSLIVTSGASDVAMTLWAWPRGALGPVLLW